MKVFISWSGGISGKVAAALREWLPSVIQSVEPYMSSEDIEKGARWNVEIAVELEASDFGILCITPGNHAAPWLLFEAGALSKSLDQGRVVPFLFGLGPGDLPAGPLVQFQAAVGTREDDVRRLLNALNGACGDHALDEGRLATIFEVWWPKLEAMLESIEAQDPEPAVDPRSEQDVLTEILELVRTQQQRLSDPEALLPAAYLRHVLRRIGVGGIPPRLIGELSDRWGRLNEMVSEVGAPEPVFEALQELNEPMGYLLRRHSRDARYEPRYIREPRLRQPDKRDAEPRSADKDDEEQEG